MGSSINTSSCNCSAPCKCGDGSSRLSEDDLGIGKECVIFVFVYFVLCIILSAIHIGIIIIVGLTGDENIVSSGFIRLIWGASVTALIVLYPKYYYSKSLKEKETMQNEVWLSMSGSRSMNESLMNRNIESVPWTRLVSFYVGFEAYESFEKGI